MVVVTPASRSSALVFHSRHNPHLVSGKCSPVQVLLCPTTCTKLEERARDWDDLAAQLVRQVDDPGLGRGVVVSLNCLLPEGLLRACFPE